MDSAVEHHLAAPAKLNLSLRIRGRRADGMHLLSGRMVLIDLCDTVSVRVRADGALKKSAKDGIAPETDLALAAARLLQRESKTPLGADIALAKKIPLGGGLGGGSSDAAAVLIALNRLWKLDWKRKKLMTLGAQLGADVPFFIYGRDAQISGIGERLRPLHAPPQSYLLAFSGQPSSTKSVFNCYDKLTKRQKAATIEPLRNSDNHLSAPAVLMLPSILTTARALARVATKVRLSGSGSTVFAAFDSRAQARRAQSQLPAAMQTVIADGLSTHPLRKCIL